MRLLHVNGRLAIERDGTAVDAERASTGSFRPDVAHIYLEWERFRA
jgi:hypothetical protein